MSLNWHRRRPEQRIGAPPLIARRRMLSAIAGLSVAALLPACGGSGMTRENENDRERLQQYREELQRYAALGYHPRYKYETESVTDFWFSPSDEVAVSLSLPRVSGRFPLIVYLPGLGESATDEGPGGGPIGGRPGGNTEGHNGGRPEASGRRPRIDPAKQIAAQERQVIAIRQFSTAFLDAVVRQDANARDWLAREAWPWLQPVGSLMGK